MPTHQREPVHCSLCGARVERRFAHRNRAGAYVCRPCLARSRGDGPLAVLWQRTRILADRFGAGLAWLAVLAAAVIVAIALVFALAGD